MTACLPDRILWELSDGEGAAADQSHLAACALCTWRARRLARDLDVLRSILRDPPPPRAVVSVHAGTAALRGMALAAVVAMAFGLAWVRGASVRDRTVVAQAPDLPALRAFSADVLGDAEVEAVLAPAAVTDLDVVAAAADRIVPCEWQPGGCADEEDDDSEGEYR